MLAISGANTLSLASGSVLNFNLGNNTNNSDEITVGGAASLGGATLDLYNIGTVAPGAYTLMTYASETGTLSIASGQLSGFSYTPTYGSTALTLNVAIAGAVTYTWTGSGGNSGWNTPGNWDQGSNYPGYLPTTDIAYFNLNNTATPTVSVNSPTTIASLTLFGGSSSARAY